MNVKLSGYLNLARNLIGKEFGVDLTLDRQFDRGLSFVWNLRLKDLYRGMYLMSRPRDMTAAPQWSPGGHGEVRAPGV